MNTPRQSLSASMQDALMRELHPDGLPRGSNIMAFNDGIEQRIAGPTRMQPSSDQQAVDRPVFIRELVAHFCAHELIDRGDEGKAHSTRHRCNSVPQQVGATSVAGL